MSFPVCRQSARVRRTRPRLVPAPSHCGSTTCPPYSAPSCPGTKPLWVYHVSAVLGPVLSRHQVTVGLPRVRRTRPRLVPAPSHCGSTTCPPYSAPSCPGTKPLWVYHVSAVLGPVLSRHQATVGLPRVRRTRPRLVPAPSHCGSTTCPPYSAPSCPGTKPLWVYHVSAVLGPVLSRHQVTVGLPRVRRTRPRLVPAPSHCGSTTCPPYSAPSCPGTKPLWVYHVSAVLGPVLSRHQATAGLPRGRLPSTLLRGSRFSMPSFCTIRPKNLVFLFAIILLNIRPIDILNKDCRRSISAILTWLPENVKINARPLDGMGNCVFSPCY